MGNANLLRDLRAVTPPLIVFDLDGTLIDSQRDLAAAANALIGERGGTPLPDLAIARMVGEGAAVLVQRALTAAGLTFERESVARFLDLYDERLLETTVAYPGIDEAVEELSARGPVAVLTNKPLDPTRRLLDGLGLTRYVAAVIGGDSEYPRKPDPAGLRHLIDSFGGSPDRTVMIGDSRIDFETARSAGTAIVVTRYGFGYQDFLAGVSMPPRASAVDRAIDLPGVVSGLLDRG